MRRSVERAAAGAKTGPVPGKAIQAATNLLITVLCAAGLAAILAAVVLVAGIRREGGDVYAVMSGSMEPAIPAGSLIVVTPCGGPEEIREGDVLAFTAGNAVAAHRVVGITELPAGGVGYRTQGDANERPDAGLVSCDDVIGVVRWHVPWAGYLSTWLKQSRIRLRLLAAAAALLLTAVLFPRRRKANEEENE